jgi:hypothetical protein
VTFRAPYYRNRGANALQTVRKPSQLFLSIRKTMSGFLNTITYKSRQVFLIVLLVVSMMGLALIPLQHVSAACAALPTDKGTVTSTISVPADGTYRAWSRIMAPDTTNNSYYLQIDNTTCGVVVGDAAIPANAWTWVDYQNGTSTSKINVPLTAGTHTVTMIGREASVKLDRVEFVADTTCIPTGVGDNCVNVSTNLPPAVTAVSPVSGSTSGGTVITLSGTDFTGSTVTVGGVAATNVAFQGTTGITATAPAHAAGAADIIVTNSDGQKVTKTGGFTYTSPTTAIVGDANNDSHVNTLDLSLLISHDGQNYPAADFNHDGTIGAADLAILLSHWKW